MSDRYCYLTKVDHVCDRIGRHMPEVIRDCWGRNDLAQIEREPVLKLRCDRMR